MIVRFSRLMPAIIVGATFFALWEGIVTVFDIKEFLLPKPSSIWVALREGWSPTEFDGLATASLKDAGWNTGLVAVSGLVTGVLAGALLALLTTRFFRFGETITPFAVAVNATPIVALAPIFNAWFGLTSIWSNIAVVVAVVFFPVFINTAKGLTEAHPDQLELMDSLGASASTTLRRVRIPNALPFFITSLRIAAPLSVIAAIVAEYFGGPIDRLGPVITQNASFARYDSAWAAIVVASALGLALFGAAVAAERLLMPWKHDPIS
jgi:NitT/TauT family transport system permease protein